MLLTAVIALGVVVAAASHLSGTKQYTVFGHPVLTVLSGSMSPTIRTGDLIVDDQIAPGQAAFLKVGQIITFRSPTDASKFFTHRIFAVRHTRDDVTFVTKGDANNAPDAVPVPASDVVGVFRDRVPFGGYVLNALHNTIVLVLLAASLLFWVASMQLFRLARARRRSEMSPAAVATPDSSA